MTTCVCNVISGTIKLVNAAMSVFTGGGGTAGPPGGPMSPLGNPLIAAVMEWARRETTRVVEFVSRTPPVAQFLHGVTQQITQAVADFGNSPFGRQFSAQIGQFLAQCEESFSLPDELERVVVVGGLTEPTDFAFLPADGGDSDTVDRIFITEKKSGTIKVYNPSDGTVTTLTTLPTVTADGERGLVGIEVDPQFWTIGAEGYHTIYVAYTGADNFDRLSKLRLDPDTLGYQSEQELLVSTELGNNFHHGGELQFDPQGEYLYWAVGDNTEGDNAQDLSNIHGKILRLDRNGEARAPTRTSTLPVPSSRSTPPGSATRSGSRSPRTASCWSPMSVKQSGRNSTSSPPPAATTAGRPKKASATTASTSTRSTLTRTPRRPPTPAPSPPSSSTRAQRFPTSTAIRSTSPTTRSGGSRS